MILRREDGKGSSFWNRTAEYNMGANVVLLATGAIKIQVPTSFMFHRDSRGMFGLIALVEYLWKMS